VTTGAGSTPAGEVQAGYDPANTVPNPRSVTLPQALYLDAATMDFLPDENGHYQEVHPVDHWVAMQLVLAFGAAPSAPAVGTTLRELAIGPREQMTADATRIVQAALADRVTTGDVRLVSVVAYAKNAWRAHVEITYQNLRAPDADRNRVVVQ